MNTTEKSSDLSNSKTIINKVIITGYLGKDPTLDTIGGNAKVARFSLATNQSYKSKGGEYVSNTLWHSVAAWNKLAERVYEELKKGSRVTVEGRINYKIYNDKNGVKKTFTEIIMSDMLTHAKSEAA